MWERANSYPELRLGAPNLGLSVSNDLDFVTFAKFDEIVKSKSALSALVGEQLPRIAKSSINVSFTPRPYFAAGEFREPTV